MAENPIFRTIIGDFIDGQAQAFDRAAHAERMLAHSRSEYRRLKLQGVDVDEPDAKVSADGGQAGDAEERT